MASKDTRQLSETPAALEGANYDYNESIKQARSEGFIRKRTLTRRGQEFIESLKLNHIKQAAKGLESKLNEVELKWLDEGSEMLRNTRLDLEKFRGILEISLKEYDQISSDYSNQENIDLVQRSKKLNEQALDMRKKLGERIFELEKEESRTRRSSRSKSVTSKSGTERSFGTHTSLKEMKLKLAKTKVELKFSRRQAELELDLQRKRFESEQLEKLRQYETAKAEKDALEEFEQQSMLSEESLKQLESQDELERLKNYILSIQSPTELCHNIPHGPIDDVRDEMYDGVNHDTIDAIRDIGNMYPRTDINDNAYNTVTNECDNAKTTDGNTRTGNVTKNHLRHDILATGSPANPLHTGSPAIPLHTGSPAIPLHTGSPANPLHTGSPTLDVNEPLYTGSQTYTNDNQPMRYPVSKKEQDLQSPVYQKADQPQNAVYRTDNDHSCSQAHVGVYCPTNLYQNPIYPSTSPTAPVGPTTGSLQSIQDIGFAIAEGMQASRLPSPQLNVFTGNPLDWPSWKAAFETVIERRTVTDSERILYLQQYLSGEARKIVEGYQFVPSSNAYEEAKKKLEQRFGNPSVVADAFRQKLERWPRIAPKDPKALRDFADFLKTCELAMNSIEDLETLSKQHENKQLLKILPSWMHPKWGSRVRDYQLKHGEAKFPPFKEFVLFVSSTAEIQCLPVLTGLESSKTQRVEAGLRPKITPSRNVGTLATSVNPSQKRIECLWCKEDHHLNSCSKFASKNVKERTKFIIRKGLCLRCLRRGHMAKENKCDRTTTCTKCAEQHPTCLHVAEKEKNESQVNRGAAGLPEEALTKCTNVCKLEGQQGGQDQCLVVPVWVSCAERPHKETLAYALLDCQSNATFITESLRKHLNVNGVESHVLLSTMHEENELIECKKVQGLTVKDFKRELTIPLPKSYTRHAIPCKPSQIPKPNVARQWQHLQGIADNIMPYRDDIEVGLLIGTNCPKAIKPREVIPGSDDDPYGIRTDLGWGIVGRVCKYPLDEHSPEAFLSSWANKISLNQVPPNSPEVLKEHNDANQVNFATETRTREVINPAEVREMFEREFHEKRDSKQQSLSMDDRRFLQKLNEGIHKRDDGHYEMPLPLKVDDVSLPNNRSQALRRLSLLKSRLKKSPKLRQDYTEFMEKTIKECAEEISENMTSKDGRVNYVAHHGVYHPKKRDKIRVVFDCSAVYQGTSLNKNLLQGPDMTNNLQGVLCRFRQEPVAFCCDVEGMFHQFFVNEEDRDLLRFFWWRDGDLDSQPVEYRMKVHLFGAASSPGCANFGFKRAAEDVEEEFGHDAADFIRRNFYVDDGLKSVETPHKAVELIRSSQALCAIAGLRLHKITSNNKNVLNAIPPEDRAKSLQEIDFNKDPLPMERTLGVMWSIESDCFQFKITVQDLPLTRRGILSSICSVFDPLGFLAPVVLTGKQLLQELCREALDWDEPISDSLRPTWEKWRNELTTLEDIKIARCFKPKNFGKVKHVELHNFSDASQSGYGQCSYLRLINENDNVHCSLTMAKARVAPLKQITIPRLELAAAVVSVNISQWLCQELEYNIQEVFHTDSQVVLGYINNRAKRFHTYVANRVQQIHNHSDPKQWQYVSTDCNPADAASRGLSAKELLRNEMWFNGPKFLWKPGRYESSEYDTSEVNPDDPELKKTALRSNAEESYPNHLEASRFDRFSDWHAAKKAVAICIRYKNVLRERIKNTDSSSHNYKTPPIGLEELHKAERIIISSVQREYFREEIQAIKPLNVKGEFVNRQSARLRNTRLRKCSNLYRLDPYFDKDGLLRVGGRLRKANMSEELKHPLILPKDAHISRIIIRHCHLVIKHQGRGMTYNQVRQSGFWIIGGLCATASAIDKCVTCKRLRGSLQQQKMADLPFDRLEPSPPFTYCGVDYFGPFVIKEGRKEVKRYGVLFTCMASRAIHIETAGSLTTDSFLNALRRFTAERGPVRQIRSDCGTNLVGAKNELNEALDEERVRNLLLKENCEFITFKMNPPSASHAGGVWERQIRTVRSVLQPLLQEAGSQLDDESFRTLMKEVQAIVNSRPLSANSLSSPDEVEPLTPNHLLTMKSKVLLPPPGVFMKADLYCRKRWRRVQHLANVFWQKWRKEFLQTLQSRKKWTKETRNMKEGDLVIIRDENLPRNQWKLGRVEKVFLSQDGLVRKVTVLVASPQLDNKGKRQTELTSLDRPIQKLVLLQPAEEDRVGSPTRSHQDKTQG